MRVVCDNCGASYKISDTKLTRDVNKATCRKCGHQIVIRRNERESLSPDMVTASSEFEQTEFSPSGMHAFGPSAGYADEVQSTIMNRHNVDHRESTVPRDVPRHAPPAIPEPPPMPMPRSALPPSYQNTTPPPSYGAAVAIPAPPPKGNTAPPPQNTGIVPPHMAPQAQPPMAPPQQPVYPQQGWRPHDPAGDLSLVMMASFGAAIGAGVLASSTTEMQTLVGLGIALWSSITSLMVLVTGDRGRKEAKVFLSMALALVLAVGATVGFRSTGLTAGQPTQPLATPTQPIAAAPTEPPAPAEPPAATLAALEPTAPVEPVVPKEPEPVVAPTAPAPAVTPAPATAPSTPPVASSSGSSGSSSRPSGSSSSSSSGSSGSSSRPSGSSSSSSSGSSGSSSRPSGSSSSSSSGSSGSSSASTAPSTSAAAAPEATGVPVTVLETMLSTNKSVKTCFGLYRQETGELPKGRITVKLTIQPSGTVNYAAIDGGPYAGTSLDSCLGSAIKKIQFPPFSGEAATYRYPFIL